MKHRDKIIQLHNDGKTRTEICKILSCSKSTVSYHLTDGQKEKNSKRQIKNRKIQHPFYRKLDNFIRCNRFGNPKQNSKNEVEQIIYQKIHTFIRDRKTKIVNTKFTIDDIINKFGENPKCYLTGNTINIYEPSTYEFDHIVPRTKGGLNTLDNLGICTKEANSAKGNLLLDDFKKLCKMVVDNN